MWVSHEIYYIRKKFFYKKIVWRRHVYSCYLNIIYSVKWSNITWDKFHYFFFSVSFFVIVEVDNIYWRITFTRCISLLHLVNTYIHIKFSAYQIFIVHSKMNTLYAGKKVSWISKKPMKKVSWCFCRTIQNLEMVSDLL